MIRFFLMNRLEKFRECLDTQIKSLIIYIYIFIHSSSLAFIFALKKKHAETIYTIFVYSDTIYRKKLTIIFLLVNV